MATKYRWQVAYTRYLHVRDERLIRNDRVELLLVRVDRTVESGAPRAEPGIAGLSIVVGVPVRIVSPAANERMGPGQGHVDLWA